MKPFITFVLVLTGFYFSACEKAVNPSTVCISLDHGSTFQIKYGESKRICDVDSSCIKFVKVVSDSRCPSDVVCIWQGTAVIELGVCDAEGGSVNLEIRKPKEYIVNGVKYSAELTELNPYPDTKHPADVEDYIATIVIKRK